MLNLGFEGTNVVPFTGIAILNKITHKADIHLSCTLEQLDFRDSNTFSFINVELLNSLLGITSIDWDAAFNSRVQIEGEIPNYTSGDSGTWGRTGLHLQYFPNLKTAGICRAYSNDLSLVGSWPLNDETIFRVGNTYHIDIWEASYS